MITKKFTIDQDQLEVVKSRIEKLNKKALKLGIQPTAITEQVERLAKFKEVHPITLKTVTKVKPVIDVTVTGYELKYGNYTHVATLDHTVGEDPIVKTVPDQELPVVYHTAKPHCDHCSTTRYRKNTYVFKENGQYRQVGSGCLKEFFGIDPTKTIDWFASFYELNEGVSNNGMNWLDSNETIISIAMAIVERTGFVGKKQATDGILTTADEVKFILCPPSHLDDNTKRYIGEIWERAAQLKTDAVSMIEWGIEKFSNDVSDYGHNMAIFLKSGTTRYNYFGYTVSLVSAYNRDVVEQAKKETTRFDNAYVGSVGDKITTEVVVDKVVVTEGGYGTTYIVLMTQTETGNKLVWFASNKVLNDGDKVSLKGTVKSLNQRDGTNQTVLTRCKVL